MASKAYRDVISTSFFSFNKSQARFLIVPRRLKDLSLNKLKLYFCELTGNLILTPRSRESARTAIRAIGQLLEQVIVNTVPPGLANELTYNIIISLNWYISNVLWQHSPSPVSSEEEDEDEEEEDCYNKWYEEVTECLLSSVFHPSVSVLNCSEGTHHDFKIWRLSVLSEPLLCKLGNLRVLRLEEVVVKTKVLLKCFQVVPGLDEFAYFWCTDNELAALSYSCRRLRILELRGSKHITDKSADAILRFENLENLDILLTSFTQQGLEELYNGYKHPLKSFSLSFMNQAFPVQHLKFMVRTFGTISSLSLFLSDDCSLTPLKYLTQLTHFSLGVKDVYENSPFHFHCARQFLQCVGHQLISLKLFNVRDTDLTFIQRNMPAIRTLVLYFRHSEHLCITSSEFLSVTHLSIFLPSAELVIYVTPLFVNLLSLTVLYQNVRFRLLLRSLQKGHPLQEVQDEKGSVLRVCEDGYMFSLFNENTREFDSAWISRDSLFEFLEHEAGDNHW